MNHDTTSISRDPVIVFQMGKVGSATVAHSIARAYRAASLEVQVHHIHLLNQLDEIEQKIRQERANPEDTLMGIRQAREVRRQIEENPEKHWNIVSLVRDPVARNVGVFFHNLPEFIPDWKRRYALGTLRVEELRELFLGLGSIHNAPAVWFDTQLWPVFGIDVFSTAFPTEVGYKIYRNLPRASLLLLRLEDLNACAGRAMREFMGMEDFELYTTNVGEEKDYAEAYRLFKAAPLPQDYVERIYSTKLARHFYSDAEREAFAARWTGSDE